MISLKARYRPRADSGLWNELRRKTLECFVEKRLPAETQETMREHVTQILERLYPAADMAVLAKYGKVRSTDFENVAIDVPGIRDAKAGINLTRPVVVPDGHYSAVSACGDYPHRADNNFNLTPEWVAREPEMAARCIADHVASKARYDARRVSPEFKPYFDAIADVRKAAKALQDELPDLPARLKAQTGDWPRWQEIVDSHPAFAEYLADMDAKIAACSEVAA